MSLFKRVTTTVTASVERLVGEIENHDAVVEAGIREARQAFATAKVRHARIVEEGSRLHQRRERLSTDRQRWQERALSADSDDNKAIECMRRCERAEEELDALATAIADHRAIESRVARELATQSERIAELERKRRLLRSREATAEAAHRIARVEDAGGIELDGAFERWEARITESELTTSIGQGDTFEAEFIAEEERDRLRARIDALRGKAGGSR